MKVLSKYLSNDVKHTFFNSFFKLLTGPLSMILIPLLITKQMQGYWYSFMSISALALLADLGFTIIVLQFAAHEFAHLKFNDDLELEGNETNLHKLISLFKFISKWGIYAVTLSFPIIFIAGFYIFYGEKTDFNWILPWIFYLIGSAIKFYLNIIISFYEGCGLVASIQKLKTTNLIITYVLNISLLVCGMHLYSLGISMLVSALFFIWQVWHLLSKSIKQMLNKQIVYYSWSKEILSLLWKYTISWISGYLIFNLFVPISFKFYGSQFAGQVGITATLITAVFSLANVWIYAVNPKLNMLVSMKDWFTLDKIFKVNLIKSILTFIGISIAAIIVFYLLSVYFPKISNRFLGLDTITYLLTAWLIQLIINSLATYSRAHKEEPFVVPSFVAGIYISVTTVLIAIYLPDKFLYYGFYTSFLFTLPWFYIVFARRRKKLHEIS